VLLYVLYVNINYLSSFGSMPLFHPLSSDGCGGVMRDGTARTSTPQLNQGHKGEQHMLWLSHICFFQQRRWGHWLSFFVQQGWLVHLSALHRLHVTWRRWTKQGLCLD